MKSGPKCSVCAMFTIDYFHVGIVLHTFTAHIILEQWRVYMFVAAIAIAKAQRAFCPTDMNLVFISGAIKVFALKMASRTMSHSPA